MSLSEVFIGLDVGGANVKAVKLRVRSGSIKIEDIARVYNPLWISGKESLERVLEELKNSFFYKLRKVMLFLPA
jgi:uncharacterized hydantoinase/oxoprolinase family protein